MGWFTPDPPKEEPKEFYLAFLSDITDYILAGLHSKPADAVMKNLHEFLAWCGIPPPYITVEVLATGLVCFACTLITYYVMLGRSHESYRRSLEKDLSRAKQLVAELEHDLETHMAKKNTGGKPIRIWMDGAFDMMHFGHMNAFRQGRLQGTELVVGINSDASIRKCKGTSPVMSDDERVAAVKGCKFVDEVVPDAPYVMNAEYLRDVVFGEYKCDYVVHGDDPCFDVDGNDVFAEAKRMGKYKEIPRTEGVSTTAIVGRLLLGSTAHHSKSSGKEGRMASQSSEFLTTNRMMRAFSAGYREPTKADKVVYVDGVFDMYHAGHNMFLEDAKKHGTYLIVGVVGDEKANALRGSNMPIMNLQERVLSVLGCRYVNDVLIDCPMELSEQMLKSLNVSVVIHGTKDDNITDNSGANDPYYAAKKMGIYKQITSRSDLNVQNIIGRIMGEKEEFQKKIAKKKKAEEEYYKERFNLEEGGEEAQEPDSGNKKEK